MNDNEKKFDFENHEPLRYSDEVEAEIAKHKQEIDEILKANAPQPQQPIEHHEEEVKHEEEKHEVQEVVKKAPATVSITNFMGVSADKDIHFEMDKTKSVSDQAQDLVNLAAIGKAVQDEELVEEITDLKKEELVTNAETDLKKKVAASQHVDKELQESTYGVYSGIADLIGLKKALPNKMLKALMAILMPFLIIYYVVVGFFTGIINISMDCINAIVERFATFTKPAKKVIQLVLIICGAAAIILVIYWLLNKYGILPVQK